MRLAYGPLAALGLEQRACRRHRIYLRPGFGEGFCIWPLEDHIVGFPQAMPLGIGEGHLVGNDIQCYFSNLDDRRTPHSGKKLSGVIL